MKTIVGSLVALSLLTGFAGQADAATRLQKMKRLKASQYSSSSPPPTKARRTPRQTSRADKSDYYEHLPDKVPFGSNRWWSVYDEQHGTDQ